MATAPEKVDKKAARGKNGKEVIAEAARTTEADGYNPDTKMQKTARAETPNTSKSASKQPSDTSCQTPGSSRSTPSCG